MISGSSSFSFPGTGRPPLTKPTTHKFCLTSNRQISAFPPLDAVPQKASQALTHTHRFGFCPQQLLERPAGSLLALTPDPGSFSNAPAGLPALGVQHGHGQEQTLSMQHLLKSPLPPGRAKGIPRCPLKAQSPLELFQHSKARDTLTHQGCTGMCRHLHTPSSGSVQSWLRRFK